MPTGPFSLVKWYLDCVTDAGDATILYCADLHWLGLHATLGSLLESPSGAEPQSHFSLGRYRLSFASDEIAVEHPQLKVSGRWQSASPSVARTVYEEPGGSIVWNCIQPGSRVSLRVGQREQAGLGYAECLTLTLHPGVAPGLNSAGAASSRQHSLTWVDWQGSHSTSFAALDGRECRLLAVSESEVSIDAATLKIADSVSLRAGRLGSTILPLAPALRRFFPTSLFNVRERKWKSPGTLINGGESSHGWVIHEVVEWEL